MKKAGILYWITGLSGAGKTTIGNCLYYALRERQDNVILLDGDILKKIVGDHLGYSDEDRLKKAVKYSSLCKTLTDQGMVVICCTIAMYDEIREWNRQNNKNYVEVFLDVPMEVLRARDRKGLYSLQQKGQIKNVAGVDIAAEFPKHPDIVLKNDGRMTVKECVDHILKFPVNCSNLTDNADLWNRFYSTEASCDSPSPFALSISQGLEAAKTLLELGCGTGQDSVYFKNLGVDVTAIDIADNAIRRLKEKYSDDSNITFICDDFVCSTTLFMRQYDYCYSRFTLQEIHQSQERKLIQNIYHALKKGGKFYIEARSIKDTLYGKGTLAEENSYICDGYFRRFIVREDLVNTLQEEGYNILYSEEKPEFASLEGRNSPVIRIIAEK